jgi:hypothetical protein
MSHKTLHRVLTALTLTLAALLTTTQVIAAPKTEDKNGVVKPATETLPPFCTAPPGGEPPAEPPTSCVSGTKAVYIEASVMWACCRKNPNDS